MPAGRVLSLGVLLRGPASVPGLATDLPVTRLLFGEVVMPLAPGMRLAGTGRKLQPLRVTKCLGGLRVAGATLITLCLAWCCMSCSAAASRLPSSASVVSATPGEQLWASTLPDGCCPVGAVSPNGSTVFVAGYVDSHFETVAYSAVTGAQVWAKAYQVASLSNPTAITVSPDGARVYVTGRTLSALGQGGATVAYAAGTGKQIWASRFKSKAAIVSAITVSPDGATVYLTGSGGVSFRRSHLAVIAYASATGKQRWLRYYTKVPGLAESVAVSPDGKTVYVTGSAGTSALTVAYQATGTLKWAARYKDPSGYAAGSQIVAGPGGGAVYVAGRAQNKSGHIDAATFAYRADTGKRIWLDRYNARLGGSTPEIALTPDGRTVIVTAPLFGRSTYAIASYNASTGGTRWTRLAPDQYMLPAGLIIDPHGNTMFIGGNRTAAYSVADGTVLWITSHADGSGIIGLSGDGTRLLGTRWNSRGITTVAYQT